MVLLDVVDVAHGHVDGGVAEPRLQPPRVHPEARRVRRERVAKRVPAPPRQPGAATHAIDAVLERRLGDRRALPSPQITRPVRTCGSPCSADASAAVIGTLRRRPPFGVPSTPFRICRATVIRPATRSSPPTASPAPPRAAARRHPRAASPPTSTPPPPRASSNRPHSSNLPALDLGPLELVRPDPRSLVDEPHLLGVLQHVRHHRQDVVARLERQGLAYRLLPVRPCPPSTPGSPRRRSRRAGEARGIHADGDRRSIASRPPSRLVLLPSHHSLMYRPRNHSSNVGTSFRCLGLSAASSRRRIWLPPPSRPPTSC